MAATRFHQGVRVFRRFDVYVYPILHIDALVSSFPIYAILPARHGIHVSSAHGISAIYFLSCCNHSVYWIFSVSFVLGVISLSKRAGSEHRGTVCYVSMSDRASVARLLGANRWNVMVYRLDFCLRNRW
jgi:hypothetical protein